MDRFIYKWQGGILLNGSSHYFLRDQARMLAVNWGSWQVTDGLLENVYQKLKI